MNKQEHKEIRTAVAIMAMIMLGVLFFCDFKLATKEDNEKFMKELITKYPHRRI